MTVKIGINGFGRIGRLAFRRIFELQEKGVDTTYDEVLADMKKRDYDDSHRAAAPLRPAEDAVTVDTTGLSLDEAIARLEQLARERLG